MAGSRIKGITVEIGGDTAKLQDALKGVNTEIKGTESKLKDVEKLLKLDPGNTELLSQKYKTLQQDIGATKEKLETLKQASEQANEALNNGTISQDQYDALQREIAETEQNLKSLEEEYKNFGSVQAQEVAAAGEKMQELGGKISGAGEKMLPATAAIVGVGTAAVTTTAEFDSAMSQVSAVSGATGDDFDALREKAREMGSKTKFSASEAAEAMNYMAMAGWKTGDMLDGIEGIMNLAAASGENLGTTSDIVTDALTAFGLSASDSGHFADILAAASSNANTNVSMLGESFKYCAPVAGAMGYSAEDTALALGLMANSGIKASQGGTALRSILTNLAKPTDQVAYAMSQLGISLTDPNGNMQSLHSLMLDLRRALGNLKIPVEEFNQQMNELDSQLEDGTITETEYNNALEELTQRAYGAEGAEKARYAATLAGKTGMSGLLAIVNTSIDDYYDLRDAILFSSYAIDDISQAVQDCGIDESMVAWTHESEDTGDHLKTMVEDVIYMMEQMGLSSEQVLELLQSEYGLTEEQAQAAFDAITEGMDNSKGSAERMAEVMQDNLNGQITILKSGIEELLIQIGDGLMPIIRNVVSVIQSWVEKLQNLDEGQKQMVAVIAVVAAAIGPLLIVIGKVLSAVGTVMTWAPKIVSMVSSIGGGITKLWGVIAAHPLLLIVAAIAAAVAAFIYLWNTSESFREFWINLWETIKEKVSSVVDAIATFFTETLPEKFNSFVSFFSALWEGVKETFSGIWESMKEKVSTIWETIKSVVQVAIMAIGSLISAAVSIITLPFQFIWENCKTIVSTAWEAIKSGVSTAIGAVGTAMSTGWETIKSGASTAWEAVKGAVTTAWEAIKSGVSTAIGAVGTAVSTGWETIKTGASTAWEAVKGAVTTAWENIKSGVSTALETIGTAISTGWETIKTGTSTAWETVKGAVTTAWEGIKEGVSAAVGVIGPVVSAGWETIKTGASTAWEAVKSTVSTAWEGIKSAVGPAVESIKTSVSTGWETIKTGASTAWEAVKTGTSTAWEGIKTTITTAINSIKTGISTGLTQAKTSAQTILTAIGNAFKTAFNAVKTTVETVVNKLKNAFNFNWQLPQLKLPHFSITGSFKLNPPSVPRFTVQWYKKAMDNGMILNKASIFGASGGKLLGGGEAGPEAVVGVSSLMEMIKNAVRSAAQDLVFTQSPDGMTQAAVDDGGRAGSMDNALITLLGEYLPYLPQLAQMQMVTDTGALVGQLAPKMDEQLGLISSRARRQ